MVDTITPLLAASEQPNRTDTFLRNTGDVKIFVRFHSVFTFRGASEKEKEGPTRPRSVLDRVDKRSTQTPLDRAMYSNSLWCVQEYHTGLAGKLPISYAPQRTPPYKLTVSLSPKVLLGINQSNAGTVRKQNAA